MRVFLALIIFITMSSLGYVAKNNLKSDGQEQIDKDVSNIVGMIKIRLLLNIEDAQRKWDEEMEVMDQNGIEIARERVVAHAIKMGMSKGFAKDFVNDQIKAAIILQKDFFETFRKEKRPREKNNSRNGLQEKIIKISRELFFELALLEKQPEQQVRMALKIYGDKLKHPQLKKEAVNLALASLFSRFGAEKI